MENEKLIGKKLKLRLRKIYFSTLSFALATFVFYAWQALAGVANTKHNLSTSGPGPIKATVETQICVFCHTPHGATAGVAPLWNRTLSAVAVYTVPTQATWPTMKSAPQNPPDGSAKLCLSCHDGTIAIGSVVNLGGAATTISMQDAGTGYLTQGKLSPPAPGYIGTDLSGHHPVSIEVNDSLISDKGIQCGNYDVSFRVCYPQSPVRLRATTNLYGAGPHTGLGVQCASCHDAHNDPVPGTTKFLLAGTAYNTTELCSKCHIFCESACP